MTEKELQVRVVEIARMYRWRVYHTWRSDRSEPGFPDLICAKPGRLLALELKTETGRLTPMQAGWLGVLATVAGVEARLVRPSDLQDTADLLSR